MSGSFAGIELVRDREMEVSDVRKIDDNVSPPYDMASSVLCPV